MRRRFAICLAGLTVLTLGGLCALWFATRPAHRIHEGTIQEIKQGMSFAEVEAILGTPPGDYSTRVIAHLGSPHTFRDKVWTSDEASIRVWFDENDCVLGARIDPIWVADEPAWQKARRWLRKNFAVQ